jgi:hypothetical protein
MIILLSTGLHDWKIKYMCILYAPTDHPGFPAAPIEGQQANYRVVCVHIVQSNMY